MTPHHRDQLREEAAAWCARMHGPDADRHRPEFERWLRAGALHLAAYNKVEEIYLIGRGVKPQVSSLDPAPRRRQRLTRYLAIPVVLGAIGSAMLIADRPGSRTSVNHAGYAQFATMLGEIRTFDLTDGSFVTLDTDTAVLSSPSATGRFHRLSRGRARFDIMKGAEPIVVAAGNSRVSGHGTVFDISVDAEGSVVIDLVAGEARVALPAVAAGLEEWRPVKAGEKLAIRDGRMIGHQSVKPAHDWTDGVVEFDGVTLGELILEANRYSPRPIVILESELRSRRISGVFRIDRPEQLIERLCDLLDLSADRSDPHSVILTSAAAPDKKITGAAQ